MKLPLEQTGFKQLNLGDKLGLGDLNMSFNLELSKKLGSTLASPRMLLNINTDDDAQLSAPPCFFVPFVNDVWAAAGSFMWSNSDGGPDDTFAQDATASTPTNLNSDQTDGKVFASSLVVTGSDDIYLLASAGTWSSLSNSLASTSGNHAMTVFKATNKAYIIDDNAAGISSLASDLSTVVKSTSGSQYSLNDLVEGAGVSTGSQLSCIASNSTRIGVGTINKSGNTSKFYTWNGSQASGPNGYLEVDASGIFSALVVDDVFLIFDSKGRILQQNGGDSGTFIELARLPLDGAPLKLPVSNATSRPVHFNGMSINEEGNIEILINTQLWDTNGTTKENCPSGVWCYDRKTKNFYHKRSFGLTKSGGTITDYGASRISLVGALALVEVVDTNIISGGRMLAGVDYYTTATVTKSGIFYDNYSDNLQKAALLTTQKIPSSQIADTWQKIYTLLGRRLLNSADKIVVKARNKQDDITEATITYTSTTTFTVPTASFTTAPVVMDEIFILCGVGAGRTAHITTIAVNDSNYEVTVDETITGATNQTAKAHFSTWRKMGTYDYNTETKDFSKLPIDNSLIGSSPWIQIRLWLLWTGKNEISSLIVASKTSEAIE